MNMVTVTRCRVSQSLMRLGRHFYPIPKQTVEAGAGALLSLGHLLRERRARKPLVVMGQVSDAIKERMLRVLNEGDIAYILWDELSLVPTVDDCEAMAAAWSAQGCDSFIALGDGAVIDAVKAASARAACRGRTVMSMVGRRRIPRRRLPTVVAVPTVAGSGAEALTAAILRDEHGNRFVMESEALMPPLAVLDSELLADAPRDRVADAGLDGLCRAIEAYLAAQAGDEHNKNLAAQAAGLFFANLEPCWNSGGDLKARENLLSASRLAARAASDVGYGYVRAICRAAQTVCDLPFAPLCGVLLPTALERYGSYAVDDLAKLAAACGMKEDGTRGERARALIGRLRSMVFRMGLPDALEGITSAQAEEIGDLAAAAANPRCVSPVVWEAEDCAGVMQSVCANHTSGGDTE